jgi:cell division protein FtsW
MDETKAPTPRSGFLKLRHNPTGQALMLTTVALLALGVVVVSSVVASVVESGPWYTHQDMRHVGFALLAVAVLLTAWRINYRFFAVGSRLPVPAVLLLVLAVGLCALVYIPGVGPVLGHAVGGKYRWLRVGPSRFAIGFQPSELLKIVLILFLAAWLTRPTTKVRGVGTFLLAGVISAGCAGLIITQDLSTAVIILLSACVVMFLAGVPWYYLASLLPVAAVAGYFFIIQTPYRFNRLLAMLDPWNSHNPAAYQSRQSILSILSGRWSGMGLGNGIRKLGFLPEDSTDFIFASFCEESGFLGAVLLMGLLLLWMWQSRKIAGRSGDSFGRVLAASLGVMIVVQAIMHIAVNMVMLPPTGISIPFISAGGTRLVMMAGATAMIVSVSARPGQTTKTEPLPNV